MTLEILLIISSILEMTHAMFNHTVNETEKYIFRKQPEICPGFFLYPGLSPLNIILNKPAAEKLFFKIYPAFTKNIHLLILK